jgi:hypothetical protein
MLGKTRRELLSQIDSPELSEWYAFLTLEQRGTRGGPVDTEKLEKDLTMIFGDANG